MSMGKGRLERYQRLRDIAERIVDGGPSIVNDDTKAALQSATMKYARTLHDDPNEGLAVIYNDQKGLGSLVRKAVEVIADHDASDDSIRAPVGDHHVSRLADLLVESGRFTDRGHALRHLTSHPDGVALVRTHKRQEPPMSLPEALTSIMKRDGLQALCKAVVDNNADGVSEGQLVLALTRFASESNPSMSPDCAFAKLYEGDLLVRKAVAVAKTASDTSYRPDVTFRTVTGADFQPQVVTGGELRDADDAEQAMKALADIGRRMAPTATPEKQFAVAFEDPKNAALAQRAHQRPQATTYFPMPR